MNLIKKIQRRTPANVPSSWSHLNQKIQQILATRGVRDLAEIEYGIAGILSPFGLKNIQQAAQHLLTAIQQNKLILIVGDFDADGATSTAVMLKSLKLLGANRVQFLVPDRFQFGYGLSVKLVEFAATMNPDLIVTVDNGIANVAGVARSNELNIPVIITDHHLAAEELPDALTIVNPNQPEDQFASKHLAGVGVAFYLMLALRSLMRSSGWFVEQKIEEPNLAVILDIVALGTVADVVVLDRNNRILVEQGLKRIRNGQACAGIQAILQVANRNFARCQASDLGFSVGPRLNAAGRLENMSIGIECLLAETLSEALPIASRLETLNKERRSIEKDMLAQAEIDLAKYFAHYQITEAEQVRPLSLCLFDPQWHQGVIGILASRVKDKINRPVIVFALDTNSDDAIIKGSARSVKGVHIRDVLALIDARNPGLIIKFGGHAMAAGLSIEQRSFQHFADEFLKYVELQLDGETIRDELLTDSSITPLELQLDFAKQLRALGPWGQGFAVPLFDDEFTVISSRVLAGEHLKLQLEKEGMIVDGILFRFPAHALAQEGQRVHLVFKIDVNEFRGNESVQLMIEQLEIL